MFYRTFVIKGSVVELPCELVSAKDLSTCAESYVRLPDGTKIQVVVPSDEAHQKGPTHLKKINKVDFSTHPFERFSLPPLDFLKLAAGRIKAELAEKASDNDPFARVLLFLELIDESFLSETSLANLHELIQLFTLNEDGFSPFALSHRDLPLELRFFEAIKRVLVVFIDFSELEFNTLTTHYKSLGIDELDAGFSEIMSIACDLRTFIYSSDRLFSKDEFVENAHDCSIMAMQWALTHGKLSLFIRLAAFSLSEDLEFALSQFKKNPKISPEAFTQLKSAILEVADLLTKGYSLPGRTKILKDWARS